MPQDLAIQILDYLEKVDLQQQLSIHCYRDDRLYVRTLTPGSIEYAKRSNIEAIPVGDLRSLVQQGEPTKILALSEDTALIDQLLAIAKPSLHARPALLHQIGADLSRSDSPACQQRRSRSLHGRQAGLGCWERDGDRG